MKKLFLLPLVGLVAAGCSTTDYYQDDLAVAQRLNSDARTPQHIQRLEQESEQQTMSRAQYEQQREVQEMEAQLEDIDSRIDELESEMSTMTAAEREQTERELNELRDRQRRAESMLIEANGSQPGDFAQARDALRNAVNELEIGIYRLQVRDSAQPGPEETL